MRTFTFAAAALACALSTVPSQAGHSPLGTWTCGIENVPAGNLIISGAGYTFTRAGTTEAVQGELVITDQQIIQVVSGPLTELGISRGYDAAVPSNAAFNATGDGAGQLSFVIGPGRTMLCNPGFTDDDNSML